MDHEDPRLMCLPASQDAAEPSAPACLPSSQSSEASTPEPAPHSVEEGAAGGFSAPVSPAAADLFAHWGSSTGAGGDDHAAAVNTLAAGMLSPQLPPGGEGPAAPWLTGN